MRIPAVHDAEANGAEIPMVVSGGASTPALARVLADKWQGLVSPSFIVTDERWSPDLRLSNAHELAGHLAGSAFTSAQVLAPTMQGDLESSALAWSHALAACSPPVVALLSMGDDGHVASLFADCRIDTVSTSVTICRESPKPPPTRLSLSAGYLRRIPERFVVAIGAGKRDTLLAIQSGHTRPVTEISPTRWFVDVAAAKGLRSN
jgi:6-phosphogluconolactonase